MQRHRHIAWRSIGSTTIRKCVVDRIKLEVMVDELQRHVPRMLRVQANETTFWDWFVGEADSFSRCTDNDQDLIYVGDRANGMLEDAQVVRRYQYNRAADQVRCGFTNGASSGSSSTRRQPESAEGQIPDSCSDSR